MEVCEFEFEFSGPDKNPDYFFLEIDRYAFIPWVKQEKYKIESHRLTLRKRINGTYEYFRYYSDEREEIVFSSKNLQDALDFGYNECTKYWEGISRDTACSHGSRSRCFKERAEKKHVHS